MRQNLLQSKLWPNTRQATYRTLFQRWSDWLRVNLKIQPYKYSVGSCYRVQERQRKHYRYWASTKAALKRTHISPWSPVGSLAADSSASCSIALTVQIHLQQNRTDLALKEIQAARKWAQDNLLVNIAESWVALRLVCTLFQYQIPIH